MTCLSIVSGWRHHQELLISDTLMVVLLAVPIIILFVLEKMGKI